MKPRDIKIPSFISLYIVILALILFCALLQFSSPALYGPDSYYHIKIASLMRHNSNLIGCFRWTQFSTFFSSYGDKDLLSHLLALPFTFIPDIILSAKLSIIFIDILLLFSLAFVLKKYLPDELAAFFIFLPFLSSYFLFYIIKLRPTVLVSIINILGISFLMDKKWKLAAIVAFIYPFAHISFPLMIIFAILCEIIRYLYQKDFFARNISAVILAEVAGLFLNPYYPNNILMFYLNGILVPFYMFLGKDIAFGMELYPVSTKTVFLADASIIAVFFTVIWSQMTLRIKTSFHTICLFAVMNVFLLLSFLSSRFWYQTVIFAVIFAASYTKDFITNRGYPDIKKKRVRILAALFICVISISWGWSIYNLKEYIINSSPLYIHYELAARWMKKNIPPGETIYHAYFSDSPYFFCLNPKNNYLVMLDPIFMVYYNPLIYKIYKGLSDGTYKEAYKMIELTFGTKFGYARKKTNLYKLNIVNNPHFKILYEDRTGVIFKIIDNPEQNTRNRITKKDA